ncbi:MAG: response regulator [Alphaproteobacteria bacterium]|nr:response regulator [Alphaproteobacteria bacterium]
MVSSSATRNKIRLNKVNVLIVDDDRAISNLIKNVLGKLGFSNITVVHNAKDGLRILEERAIDLMITDWEMDPISGVELTQMIRRMDSPKRFMPIIMLTGHGEKSEIELARDCGITEYLIKPFTAKTLCSRIMMVVESPRSFILSPGYKGPSRRRRSSEPPEGLERRKKREEDK